MSSTGRAFACAALSLLGARELHALDPRRDVTQYVHDVWTVKDGLPSNQAVDFAQTADGYLWMGVARGLVRFDGVRFVVYDESAVAGLGEYPSLLADSGGQLWIGGRGSGVTRLEPGTLRPHTMGLALGPVSTLSRGAGGSVLATTEPGVFRCRGRDLTPLVAREALPRGGALEAAVEDRRGDVWIVTDGPLYRLSGGGVTPVEGVPVGGKPLEDRQGSFWIGTPTGLVRLRDGVLTRYSAADGLPGGDVGEMYEDRAGRLWVATEKGLALREGERFKAYTAKDGLTSTDVRTMTDDRDGNLWIGTIGGLYRLSGSTLRELPGFSWVDSITEDREGSLWITALGGSGLHRLRDGKLLVYTTRQGLATDNARTAFASRDGAVWIGTAGGMAGGLSRVKDGSVTTFTAKDGIAGPVYKLCEDGDGTIWIGTGGGTLRYRDGVLTRIPEAAGFRAIADLLVDHEGALWATSADGGLIRLLRGTRTTFGPADGLPARGRIMKLLEDRQRTLWVSTESGLYRRREHETLFERYARPELGDGLTLAVAEDGGGGLWIQIADAFLRLEGEKLVRFGRAQGLSMDRANTVATDEHGDLWLPSDDGINYVTLRDVEAVAEGRAPRVRALHLGAEDGMLDPECNGTQVGRGPDGRLWFPTMKGVVVVDPAHLPRNEVVPPVSIEAALGDGRLATGAERVFPPGTRTIEIRYTATSFLVPGRVRFKYRLDGYDSAWVDAATERTAHYTNLPPRDYTFRVKACNDDGVWNETGASLAFTLLPRFFQTSWFHGLEGASGLGLVALGFVFQRRRLLARADHKRKSEELEHARRVQLALLPKEPLTVGDWAVAGAMQTATEVGGDYFGYLETGGRLCVVIADATGHGMSSGLVAGMLKSSLASLARTPTGDGGAAAWLEHLNAALRDSISQRGLGVCVGIALVDMETGGVEVGSAGVPHLFHLKASGAVERLPLSGTPLGYLKKIVIASATRTLVAGDRLVLITDGLIEQTNAAGEEWGYAGVEAALAAASKSVTSPQAMAEALLHSCDAYAAGRPTSDDRTVLVLARR